MNFVIFFGSKEMYSQLKEHRRNADLKEVSTGMAKAHLVPFLGSTSTIQLLVGSKPITIPGGCSIWLLHNLAGPISCVFSNQPTLNARDLPRIKIVQSCFCCIFHQEREELDATTSWEELRHSKYLREKSAFQKLPHFFNCCVFSSIYFQ